MKYEYKEVEGGTVEMMNALGAEGWKVKFIRLVDGGQATTLLEREIHS